MQNQKESIESQFDPNCISILINFIAYLFIDMHICIKDIKIYIFNQSIFCVWQYLKIAYQSRIIKNLIRFAQKKIFII